MPAKDVVLKVLDGHDTIGGTKILVGWEGEGAFLDFGINYAKWYRYCEEFLQPRANQGLGDLWRMGFIPQTTGIYRGDLVPPKTPVGNGLDVRSLGGVFLSHAHLDHAGLIGLLDLRTPLVTSRLSAAILKALQDTGSSELWSEVVYTKPRRSKDEGDHVVHYAQAADGYVGRPLRVTDGAGPASFTRFWEWLPEAPVEEGVRKRARKEFSPGEVRPFASQENGIAAKSFAVDHSVMGGAGFILESPNGPIAYSGDLRQHGARAGDTKSFLEGLARRRPYVLIIEGTHVVPKEKEQPGLYSPTTEDEVRKNCQAAIDRFSGKVVVADFAPRNVERLLTFLRIAHDSKRRLVILPKDAYLLHAMHQAEPSIPVPGGDLLIYRPPAVRPDLWVRAILGQLYPSAVVGLKEIRRAPGDFILSFSYWDMMHLLDVAPQGGAYLYSNSEAFTEEQRIDFERLHRWIQLFGMEPVGFSMKPHPYDVMRTTPVFHGGFHSTGHMSGQEVREWVLKIHPENLLPVHTEHRDLVAEAARGQEIHVLDGGLDR